MKYQAHGLGETPQQAAEEAADYQDENDNLAEWMTVSCELDAHAETSLRELWDSYRILEAPAGERMPLRDSRALCKQLRVKYNLKRQRRHAGTYVKGIKLKSGDIAP